MSIYVRRKLDGTLSCSDGRLRLIATIRALGTAKVVVHGSGEVLTVHEVNGKLVALTEAAQNSLVAATEEVIQVASRRRTGEQ